ncbi:MAG: hypothetical protein HN478_20570 [Rhodospirillaceae bacterium]|nr:hypothetical protein [Rhodospirillaceae bacterium]
MISFLYGISDFRRQSMQGLGRRLEVQCFAGGFYGIQFCVQPVPGQGGMKVRKFPFNLDASFAAQTKHFINYLHGDDLIQRPAFGGPGIRQLGNRIDIFPDRGQSRIEIRGLPGNFGQLPVGECYFQRLGLFKQC